MKIGTRLALRFGAATNGQKSIGLNVILSKVEIEQLVVWALGDLA